MTDNQKLQLWQAGILGNPDESQVAYNTPDYLNDDTAAMSLLDTLVEKGHAPKLEYDRDIKQWGFMLDEDCGYEWLDDTRRTAVVAAVLELIGKEDV